MSLPLEDLAAAGQAIVGRDLATPKVSVLIRPPPWLMSRLLRLHEAAGHLAATTPDILAHPEVAKAIAGTDPRHGLVPDGKPLGAHLSRRLKLVRAELRRISSETQDAIAIVTRYGFPDLHRFVIEYRDAYGEMPPISPRKGPGTKIKSDLADSA